MASWLDDFFSFVAGGDIAQPAPGSQTVIGIRGAPVDSRAPASGETLVFDGTKYVPTKVSAAVSIYGDGSDGAVTLGSNTTLTRDMYYSSLDLAGYTLTTGGYRVFVTGTLTFNGGKIACNGSNGGSNQVVTPGGSAGTLGGGCSSGSVGAESGVGNSTYGLGGSGGAASGDRAITGGTIARSAAKGHVRNLLQAISGRALDGVAFVGGGSGGCGRNGGNFSASGNGGGGGGVVMVAAKTISGTGTIEAKGGNGTKADRDRFGGTDPSQDYPSGGGGGGGAIIIVSSAAVPGTVTLNVSGGTSEAPSYVTPGQLSGLPGSSGSVFTLIS